MVYSYGTRQYVEVKMGVAWHLRASKPVQPYVRQPSSQLVCMRLCVATALDVTAACDAVLLALTAEVYQLLQTHLGLV